MLEVSVYPLVDRYRSWKRSANREAVIDNVANDDVVSDREALGPTPTKSEPNNKSGECLRRIINGPNG